MSDRDPLLDRLSAAWMRWDPPPEGLADRILMTVDADDSGEGQPSAWCAGAQTRCSRTTVTPSRTTGHDSTVR